jgi:hypothetical protein
MLKQTQSCTLRVRLLLACSFGLAITLPLVLVRSTIAKPTPQASTTVLQKEELVSIDFREAPIRDAIKSLMTSNQCDYIINSDIAGSVTLKADKISLGKVLDTISQSAEPHIIREQKYNTITFRSAKLSQTSWSFPKEVSEEAQKIKDSSTFEGRVSGIGQIKKVRFALLETGILPDVQSYVICEKSTSKDVQQKMGLTTQIPNQASGHTWTVQRINAKEVVLREGKNRMVVPLRGFTKKEWQHIKGLSGLF